MFGFGGWGTTPAAPLQLSPRLRSLHSASSMGEHLEVWVSPYSCSNNLWGSRTLQGGQKGGVATAEGTHSTTWPAGGHPFGAQQVPLGGLGVLSRGLTCGPSCRLCWAPRRLCTPPSRGRPSPQHELSHGKSVLRDAAPLPPPCSPQKPPFTFQGCAVGWGPLPRLECEISDSVLELISPAWAPKGTEGRGARSRGHRKMGVGLPSGHRCWCCTARAPVQQRALEEVMGSTRGGEEGTGEGDRGTGSDGHRW